ncbi:MAG TPA: ABC transporter ATP-binding protein [Chitinophagaceae bacterium]|nr:ABC transporter ATP-binding protein [Chitinophagaceae bacterium]
MLHFENVQKDYGAYTALTINSFVLNDGVVWLRGENGSGKTTLLKMIAGLLPFKGDITINNAFSIKKQRRQFIKLVNYAETEPLYPGFLTAKELVKLYCHAKDGNMQETENLLQQLHVFDAYKKPLAAYSSGMIKKLSIALAFIGSPKWILLDEPLVTVDVASVEIICSLIEQKHSAGTSFLITSHQPFYSGGVSFTSSLLAEGQTIKNAAI